MTALCRAPWVALWAALWVASGVPAWAQGAGELEPDVDLADLVNAQYLTLPMLDQMEAKSVLGLPRVQSGVSLRELIDRGLETNQQLKQAQARLEASQAQRKVARADLLPSFTLRNAVGPEQSQVAGSGLDSHNYRVSTVRLTQPLYNASAFNEFASAQQAEQSADLRLRSTQESTVMSVVRAAVDLASARVVLEFADAQLGQLQSVLNYLENRTQAGATSRSDLERALTRVYAARQTRLDQQTAYRNAMVEVQRLTETEPTAIELPSLKQFPALKQDRMGLRESAVTQNPDIAALEREVAAQQLRVKSELTRLQPVLGLSLEQDAGENVRAVNSKQTDTRALLVLNWGFSLGGKEWYQAEAAKAELRQREARLSDEKQRLLQTLDGDLAVLSSAKLRIGAAQLEQASAGRVVEAVNEQLRVGRLGSLLEALDAIERDFGARQRLIAAVSQTIKAHAQILQRTGQLNAQTVLDAVFTSPASLRKPAM